MKIKWIKSLLKKTKKIAKKERKKRVYCYFHDGKCNLISDEICTSTLCPALGLDHRKLKRR